VALDMLFLCCVLCVAVFLEQVRILSVCSDLV